jgi:hypothetical protein
MNFCTVHIGDSQTVFCITFDEGCTFTVFYTQSSVGIRNPKAEKNVWETQL